MAPRPPRGAYRRAQLAARRNVRQLEVVAARRISAAIDEYADTLARSVRRLPKTIRSRARTRALEATIQVQRRAQARLERSIAAAVAETRVLSYDDVLDQWNRATLDVANTVGVPNSLLGAVRAPPLTLLGAYEGLGGAASNWRTIVAGQALKAAEEADHIIRTAFLGGADPEKLARRLRPYVQGSETLRQAFGDLDLEDLRDLRVADPAVRGALKRMTFNARRIAFSEVHNARAEAELQAMAVDPLVEAIIWLLAPDRGTLRSPDQCDVYASNDIYGLGVAVFPLDKVPLPPHAYDRCERVPKVRGRAQAGDPKPSPNRRLAADELRVPCARF